MQLWLLHGLRFGAHRSLGSWGEGCAFIAMRMLYAVPHGGDASTHLLCFVPLAAALPMICSPCKLSHTSVNQTELFCVSTPADIMGSPGAITTSTSLSGSSFKMKILSTAGRSHQSSGLEEINCCRSHQFISAALLVAWQSQCSCHCSAHSAPCSL